MISPLRRFVLAAALWLPAMFFLWFVLQSAVVYLPIRLTAWVLTAWMPDIFTGMHQEFHEIVYGYIAPLGQIPGLPTSRIAVEDQRNNVLVFCYGLPLLYGLVMATPLNWRRTWLQLGIGLAALTGVAAFGLVGTVLKTLAFGVRPAIQAALEPMGYGTVAIQAAAAAEAGMIETLARHGLGPDAIALASQFGYLVLPAVTPVALWILMNRRFLEALVGWNGEPDTRVAGPSPGADNGGSGA